MEKKWGSQFWFVLHTIAFSYPKHPNKVTKRKYYDTVMNIPLFLPNSDIGDKFSKLLDKYPVTPYLDSRESFIKWTHFVHNRVNEQLQKPIMSYANFIDKYTRTPPTLTSPKKHRGAEWETPTLRMLILVCIIIIGFNIRHSLR